MTRLVAMCCGMLFLASNLHAQCVDNGQQWPTVATFVPAVPAPGETVVLSLGRPISGEVDSLQIEVVAGHVLVSGQYHPYDFDPPLIPQLVPINLGELPAGSYGVRIHLIEDGFACPEFVAPLVVGGGQLSVAQAPAIGMGAKTLLVLVLVLAAMIVLHKKQRASF